MLSVTGSLKFCSMMAAACCTTAAHPAGALTLLASAIRLMWSPAETGAGPGGTILPVVAGGASGVAPLGPAIDGSNLRIGFAVCTPDAIGSGWGVWARGAATVAVDVPGATG